ncbi:MAG TPA: FAD-dependent oxidoreductase, partial [Mycobacterium sp.]
MRETADVVIVGGGIEGSAAAWALSRRGVTDVVVAERHTVGSGMTGKSSGIVRCHYGVSSLAAMAAVGLEVFEQPQAFLGEDVTDIGFRQTGYVVGVGEPNVDSLRKSLAAQRAVGVDTEEIDHGDVAKLWPFADLAPFAAFGWEARGGYGDAYQAAQAFSTSARAAGVRVRQGCTATGLLVDGDRVTGVRLADGTEISAGTVVVATGVWTRPFLAPYGVDVPIRVIREQIVMI